MAGMRRHLELLPWRLIPLDINIKIVSWRRTCEEWQKASSKREDDDKGCGMSSTNSDRYNQINRGSQNAQNRLINLQKKFAESLKDQKDRWSSKSHESKKSSPKSALEEHKKRKEDGETKSEDNLVNRSKKPIDQGLNKSCKAQARLEQLRNKKNAASGSDPVPSSNSKVLRKTIRWDDNRRNETNGSSPCRSLSSSSRQTGSTKDNKSSTSYKRNLYKRKIVEDDLYRGVVKPRKVDNETNCHKLLVKNRTKFESPSSPDTSPTTNVIHPVSNSSSKVNTSTFKLQRNKEEYIESMEWEPLSEEHIIAELQTVRNNVVHYECSMDNFCESMCVDINIPPSDTMLYIVIDTNILISNITLIKTLLTAKIEDFKVVLIIPWQVLKELDYLKQDSPNRNKSVGTNARRAIKFLLDNASRIRCQSQKDSLLNNVDIVIENPDDNIIKCCLQIQLNGHNTVLLSNDQNLCLKCTTTRVVPISENEMLHIMAVRKPLQLAPYGIESQPKEEDSVYSLCYITYHLAEAMKEFLSHVIECGLKNRYQFLWKSFAKVPPPWNLNGLMTCAESQWPEIVQEENGKHQIDKLKSLSKFFSSVKSNKTLTDSDLFGVLQQCDRLITTLPDSFKMYVDEMKSKLEQTNDRINERKNYIMVLRITRVINCFRFIETAAKCHWRLFQSHCNNVTIGTDLTEDERLIFANLQRLPLDEVIHTLEVIIFMLNKMNNIPLGETRMSTNGIPEMYKCLAEFCGKVKLVCELEQVDLVEFNNDIAIRNSIGTAIEVFGAYLQNLIEMRNYYR